MKRNTTLKEAAVLRTEAIKLKSIIDTLLEFDEYEGGEGDKVLGDHRAFMDRRENFKDEEGSGDKDIHKIQSEILKYVHSKIGMAETVEDEYKFLRVMLRLVKIERDEDKREVMVKLIRESLETLFQDSKITDMISIS